MARRLNKGHIYRFDYKGPYATDGSPLVLVLYSGDEWTHAITLTPLGSRLTEQLIEFIAQVATKRLKASDTYALYHNHLKRDLPGVVKLAYRTYKTKRIKNPYVVSKGYFSVKHFLNNLRHKFSPKETKDVIKNIRAAIKFARKSPEKQVRRQQIFSLFQKDEKISTDELHRRVLEYMGHIRDIKKNNKARLKRNYKKYTYI